MALKALAAAAHIFRRLASGSPSSTLWLRLKAIDLQTMYVGETTDPALPFAAVPSKF